jgi:dienelactone hydrolase
LVIVGVYSPRGRDLLYAVPPAGGADRMADFLADALLPAIRARVPIAANPGRVGVIGYSFGANMALYAGLRRSDAFGLAAALSPYPHYLGPQVGHLMAERRRLPCRRLYIDCGWWIAPKMRVPDSVDFNKWLMGIARARCERGRFLGRVVPRAFHTEASWRRRLPTALRFLYRR